MAPAIEPVAPQAPEPEVIELKPITPAEEPQQDHLAASAAAPPPAEPEPPAMAPEPAPPAPAEPEIAPLVQDAVEAPEQPLAPPPPPEPAPEIQVLTLPAPVEEAPVDLPVAESLAPPATEPAFELPVTQSGAFRVVVRLTDGDGVEVGEFRDFGTAMQGAQEVIDQVSHSNGSWPFFAGRFIRPDLIVSVDVFDAAS